MGNPVNQEARREVSLTYSILLVVVIGLHLLDIVLCFSFYYRLVQINVLIFEKHVQVISGIETAVKSMKVGGVRRVVIPPSQGYLSTSQEPIPPNVIPLHLQDYFL